MSPIHPFSDECILDDREFHYYTSTFPIFFFLFAGEYELQDGASLTLDILDTSGAYQFPAMRALSVNTADAFILVYSVDDNETWEEVTKLREQVKYW